MKLKKIFILLCFLLIFGNACYATEEVYDEVSKGFGISDFTKEASKYTKENFPDFDLDMFVRNSFTGKSNLGFVKAAIVKIFGDEITSRNKAHDKCFGFNNNWKRL